jgi:endo-1,4-beta-xylanase
MKLNYLGLNQFINRRNTQPMINKSFYRVTFIAYSLIAGCARAQTPSSSQIPSLKETFRNDFLIGAAINTRQIEEKDSNAAELIPQQFSAITPENIMKAGEIHPQWDKYNFDLADKIVEYGKKYNIKVNGHTLIWHSQLPAFMRSMKDADSVRKYFVDHITTVAGRYDGKIFSWDVVNEALNEDGTMRKSIFSEKLGDDF